MNWQPEGTEKLIVSLREKGVSTRALSPLRLSLITSEEDLKKAIISGGYLSLRGAGKKGLEELKRNFALDNLVRIEVRIDGKLRLTQMILDESWEDLILGFDDLIRSSQPKGTTTETRQGVARAKDETYER